MTPGHLLEALEAAGVELNISDGWLKYRAPVGAYTDEFRALVAEHRAELVAGWRCWLCGAISRVLFGMGPMLRCRPCARREAEARRWWAQFKEGDRARDGITQEDGRARV